MAPAAIPVGLEVGMTAANVLSGLFQGYMQGKITEQQLKAAMAALQQQGALSQEGLGQSGISQSNALARQSAMLPMRDQASYMLQQRMGMTPRTFSPSTMGGSGSPGGIDLNQLQQAAAAYKPGMGGQMGVGDYNNSYQKQLGYDPANPGGGYKQPEIAPVGSYPGSLSYRAANGDPRGAQPKYTVRKNPKTGLLEKMPVVGGMPDGQNPGWTGT